MPLTIDYCLVPQSPYAYLGHARFATIAEAAQAKVRLRVIDLGGKVFPVSGGLPLAQRAPQRQAYRLVELRRFSEWLGLPLNLHPAHFPVAADNAARLIIAVDQLDGTAAAMRLGGAMLKAVWAEDRNLADAACLRTLLEENELTAERLTDAAAPEVQARYEADTAWAIGQGVFGAPSYLVEGEIFWGQDRLDFLQRRLARG
jgi:2-hydroxychromene-2-carboxylate isomerase